MIHLSDLKLRTVVLTKCHLREYWVVCWPAEPEDRVSPELIGRRLLIVVGDGGRLLLLLLQVPLLPGGRCHSAVDNSGAVQVGALSQGVILKQRKSSISINIQDED